ncbi:MULTISPECIES: carboxypeptidase M32 [unclassified Rhizobium]|uniref:carboxypeptidase M32 n=1 Tax=unclassified Rhizobium TaxID=2613769 RepID=UPI001ADB6BE9|nr:MULTISPECIES: carboxypeptidase M32 [unclassified Rhizobium]MBO9096790.1 carboxypeptidase M32 [Rhizobium sp. L58/93]QXZ83382.1 carboxypeptidase M32 [Rhizobium sp. K1/93]QXZ89106.1 carboxypeptidase M32 [Rhizobium sp. K15/93]QYA01693.1 carboxypeptidase M32 [Rhizobium sp. B21/90]
MSFAVFETEIARINDILCAVNLLTWDSRTMMPAGGVEARGRQIATLVGLARDMATGDGLQRAIETARAELRGASSDDLRLVAVEQAAASIAKLSRIPAKLVAASTTLKTQAQAAWVKARAANDFAGFAPVLERTMEMQREIAGALGYEEHPYDALVDTYEPGMRLSKLQTLYGQLQQSLIPLLAQAKEARVRSEILDRSYPVETQRQFSSMMATRLGYDFGRGRLDDAVHPFEISFTRSDVRITGRFRETWLPGGLFAVWHEGGHGLYEQGISEQFSRSTFTTDFVNLYAVGGASFGMHESQSRLLENRVGRSRRFWDLHFHELKAVFPEQLSDVSVDDFWRVINAARPSLIRVEADELTYDFHIMLRSEIEAGLIASETRVADLPEIWRDKVKSYLGLDVSTDTLGVLQDVHWSSGMVGSFPTYTVGNIMSSQLFSTARKEAAVEKGLESGDYMPLKSWLQHNVHQHGRSKSPGDILVAATGSDLSADAYIADLTAKVADLTA